MKKYSCIWLTMVALSIASASNNDNAEAAETFDTNKADTNCKINLNSCLNSLKNSRPRRLFGGGDFGGDSSGR